METKYDNAIDAKYILLKKGKVCCTRQVEGWLLLDFDKNNDVLGLEILEASKHPISLLTSGEKLLSIYNISYVDKDRYSGLNNFFKEAAYNNNNLWLEPLKNEC